MRRHVSSCIALACLVPSCAQYSIHAAVSTILNDTGVVHVSDVSRVIRRYLSGISARLDVSCLRGVSAAGTYLPYTKSYPTRLYYPYYCILPLPPTPTSYYPYYPYPLPPTTPTTPYVQYPYYPCYLLLLLCYPYFLVPLLPSERFMYRVCIP